MATDATSLTKARTPTPEDFSKKTQRHRQLVLDVSKVLAEIPDFRGEAVPTIAQLIADYLQAECVCIFFRRKASKDLERWALAINQHCKSNGRPRISDFRFDEKYEKDDPTLMWTPNSMDEPFAEERLKGHALNLGPDDIAKLPENIQTIVTRFRQKLSSGQFSHVIIVQIRLFDKLLGAIRCVNHLDSLDLPNVSRRGFKEEEDVSLVASIGAFLAPAYANYRKTEKLKAVTRLRKEIERAGTEEEAVFACLRNLASDSTGFPLAMWRVYEADGRSTVEAYEPEVLEDGTNPVPGKLPLKAVEGVPLAAEPECIDIEKHPRFHYRSWADKYNLKAMYTHKIPLSDGRYAALVVFADEIREFDDLSIDWITANMDLLKSTLARMRFESTVKRIQEDSKTSQIVGKAPAIRDAIAVAIQAAVTDATVLLHGETGTGKERFARLIRDQSRRSGGPFEALNCGAVAPHLFESELFGHEKGAFTGAISQRIGRFELADKGVLFLDEIGSMQPDLQAKLLRVLQERVFRRVGGKADIKVDVRIVAASNKDLYAEVQQGRFREDLYYRLNVIRIELPPLRDRKLDIPDFMTHFQDKFNSWHGKKVIAIHPLAMKLFQGHDWPGNVRELENAIERAVVTAKGDTITVNDLPPEIQSAQGAMGEAGRATGSLAKDTAALEREKIVNALNDCGWVAKNAAKELGMAYSTLRQKMKDYGIRRGKHG